MNYGSDDSDAKSAPSGKSEYKRSVPSSGLEDSFDSHMYDESNMSGIGKESCNVKSPSDEKYFLVSGSEMTNEPSNPSVNCIVDELDQGFTDNDALEMPICNFRNN